ncbi:hypothetical protein K466DRAFT_668561 [Polyporus arcularius HHB13444]|uniref:Uncharacterized protein n=1 Tax=Polyporus arcularius HHB13444 TaxID=1314778 RepID=A0A5C3NJS5_9APHY|nr:hypothetical protein K466DRAFT_668561 [Polyporus arcularius HHB13444]
MVTQRSKRDPSNLRLAVNCYGRTPCGLAQLTSLSPAAIPDAEKRATHQGDRNEQWRRYATGSCRELGPPKRASLLARRIAFTSSISAGSDADVTDVRAVVPQGICIGLFPSQIRGIVLFFSSVQIISAGYSMLWPQRPRSGCKSYAQSVPAAAAAAAKTVCEHPSAGVWRPINGDPGASCEVDYANDKLPAGRETSNRDRIAYRRCKTILPRLPRKVMQDPF